MSKDDKVTDITDWIEKQVNVDVICSSWIISLLHSDIVSKVDVLLDQSIMRVFCVI